MAWFSPAKITGMDGAKRHRTYALVLLMLVYACNFIDRRIMGVLATPIKTEFNFSDAEIGMLTGFFFAIVYTVIGVPIARIADSTSRKLTLNVSLGIWSLFTLVSGLVTSKIQMIGARMAVGIGEAGGSPPAHAIVSDLYEPRYRARALAIYSSGIYIGTLLANYGGGWMSDARNLKSIAGSVQAMSGGLIHLGENDGWRVAFVMVGLPGLILALLVQLTLREPLKGLSGAKPVDEKFTFMRSFKHLWGLKSFRYFSIATGAGTFVTYGLNDWMVSFMERTHHLDRTTTGYLFGTVAGLFGAVGTIAGGVLADHLGKKDKRWFLWVPMWGKFIGGPIFLLGMIVPNAYLSLACYGLGLVLAAAYLGPALAVTHSLVQPGMRAMSSAVLYVFLNILGIGFGPMLVGIWSDRMNDASACVMSDRAVIAAQSCPATEDVLDALRKSPEMMTVLRGDGSTPNLLTVKKDGQGVVQKDKSGADIYELRPPLTRSVLDRVVAAGFTMDFVVTRTETVADGKTVRKEVVSKTPPEGVGLAPNAERVDLAQKQGVAGKVSYGLREVFPGVTALGVGQESLRWAMILCIILTYPLAILWHLGARALPKEDDPSQATVEAVTMGDVNAKSA